MNSLLRGLEERLFAGLGHLDQLLHFSSLFSNSRNVVLMYHSIGDPERFGDVSPDRLRRDLRYLDEQYQIVDLPEVLTWPARGAKRIAITFDDGYRTFYRNAMPIVREFEIPVTVFVPVGLIDDGAAFTYRLRNSPDDLYHFNDFERYRMTPDTGPETMSLSQLRELVASEFVTLGNHTLTHPDLGAITDSATLETEIRSARDELEMLLDVTVDRFCYPYGRYSPEALDVVRNTHSLAVTTTPKPLGDDTDPYLIPRLSAHESETALHWNLVDLRWRLTEQFGRQKPGYHSDRNRDYEV